MHGCNHNEIVLFGVQSLRVTAFINGKHCVLGCAFRVLANACVALL